MTISKELVSWLNGYVDGVTAVNGMTTGRPRRQRFSARAYVIEDANKDIDAVLSKFYSEACSRLKVEFANLDVVEYLFEPAEVHVDWIRWAAQATGTKTAAQPLRRYAGFK